MNNIPQRMWDKVEMEPMSGCWIWTGAISGGYGQTSVGRKALRSHRVFYRALRGEIPDGLVLDHLCRLRCCVNPAHLEPVTPKENVRRGLSGSYDKTHCVHGHPLSGDNVVTKPDRGGGIKRVCVTCRRAYGDRAREDRWSMEWLCADPERHFAQAMALLRAGRAKTFREACFSSREPGERGRAPESRRAGEQGE